MVGNGDVAATLERIAGLLEIRGDNVFKVRAYRTATAQIENLSEPLVEIMAAGGLRELPGFGEAIVAQVEETEEDVYACLGLRWIPPALREDRGELEVSRLAEPCMATQEV